MSLERRLSEAEEKILALKTVAEAAIELSAEPAEDFITQYLAGYYDRRSRV
jgi:hypothetical protein